MAVASVGDEPWSTAAAAMAEPPSASAAAAAPAIKSCLVRVSIIVVPFMVRALSGYEIHDGRGPWERRERNLRNSNERPKAPESACAQTPLVGPAGISACSAAGTIGSVTVNTAPPSGALLECTSP